jgi:hypothetical protein
MVMGYTRMKEFMRRSAGIDIDKSDMERLTDLIGRKLHDLLVIGVRNASYNNRDVVMEPDLPLTKGILEHLPEFRRYEETIDLKPILGHLPTARAHAKSGGRGDAAGDRRHSRHARWRSH